MKKCSQASDDQKLRKNFRQAAITCDAESRYDKKALSDDDLELVSAAGDATVPTMNPDVLLGRHAIPNHTRENKP